MQKKESLKFLSLVLIIGLFFSLDSNGQVGVGTTAPNAALDVTSTNDGFLVPRVALTITTSALPLTTPTTSEMVYNTATVADVTPGYYYWDGAKWVRLLSGATNDWSLTGNTGTVAGTNFIGTTDAIDFRIKTNSTDRWNISNANTGQLQSYSLGTAALPSYSWQGDQNTGLFSSAADNLDFTTGGTARFRIPAANQVQALSLGTAALPFYTFSADPDTGLWSPAANTLALSTNGTEKARVDTNGAVGIGTTTPNGVLDVNATANNYGFVAPRVALTATNAQAPVTNPQGGAILAGTTVYNTATAGASPNNVAPGLYYWNGARWIAFAGAPGGLDWTLTGNAGTTVGTNFLGTTDAVDVAFYTNNTEKMRVGSNGSVTINTGAAPAASEKFQVNHTGAGNDAMLAINNDDTTGKGNAIWAKNTNATGVAIIGSSGATPPNVLPTIGAGISGSHVDGYGLYATTGNGAPNNAAHNGHAAGGFLLDNDNSVATAGSSAFAKLAGKDNVSPNGILGAAQVLYGGYFQGGVTTAGAVSYAYTGIKYNHTAAGSGGTDYKVIGNGVASTIINDKDNIPRVMFCPEAPEVLFEDYGVSKLSNGEAYIPIDNTLALSMRIDEKHPLKVFIQLEGDCNGVFVTEKTAKGFKVKELQNGASNVSFSWHIVANRADRKDPNGTISSEFENLRLPIGPAMLKPDVLATRSKQ